MMGKTHVTGAIAAGTTGAALAQLDPVEACALTATSAVAAGLPDEDRVLDDSPNHRSLTHSLSFAVVLFLAFLVYLRPRMADLGPQFAQEAAGLPFIPFIGGFGGEELAAGVGSYLAGLLFIAVAGLGLGYLSHLLLDALTPAGIWLVLPGGPRLRVPVISKVGDAREAVAERLLAVVALGGAGVVLWRFEPLAGLARSSAPRLNELLQVLLGAV